MNGIPMSGVPMGGIPGPRGHLSRALAARLIVWEHDTTTATIPVHA